MRPLKDDIRLLEQITSNKTKHLEVQKKLNSLITKDYSFFLGRIYVYQPALDTLELKKSLVKKVLIMFLVGN